MATTRKVYVTKVVTEVDMRGVHKVRHRYATKGLTLLLNRAGTIARFIVPAGNANAGVWTYYAPKGHRWDELAIKAAVSQMGLALVWREGAAMPKIVREAA